MHKSIAIYLAGPIQKEHENVSYFWTKENRLLLAKSLKPHEITYLDPAMRSDDLSDQLSVFGRDMLQVFSSDIVFVDALDRRGIGVGAEMMWAKLHKIPVITLAPRDSHYYKGQTTLLGVPVKNWVHPFVESLSDTIVENLAEGAKWIKTLISDSPLTIKGIESIEMAMQHYRQSQLPKDTPMQELIQNNQTLKKRIQNFDVMNSILKNYVDIPFQN